MTVDEVPLPPVAVVMALPLAPELAEASLGSGGRTLPVLMVPFGNQKLPRSQQAHSWVTRYEVKTAPVSLAGMRTWSKKGPRVDSSSPSVLAGAPMQGTRWPVWDSKMSIVPEYLVLDVLPKGTVSPSVS